MNAPIVPRECAVVTSAPRLSFLLRPAIDTGELLAGYRACRFYAMRRACLALAELLRATAYDGAQMQELLLVWLKLYDAAIVVAYGHALACCNDPRRAYRVFCERAVQEQLRENVQRMAVEIVGEPRNEPRGSTFEERVLDDIEFAKVRVA